VPQYPPFVVFKGGGLDFDSPPNDIKPYPPRPVISDAGSGRRLLRVGIFTHLKSVGLRQWRNPLFESLRKQLCSLPLSGSGPPLPSTLFQTNDVSKFRIPVRPFQCGVRTLLFHPHCRAGC